VRRLKRKVFSRFSLAAPQSSTYRFLCTSIPPAIASSYSLDDDDVSDQTLTLILLSRASSLCFVNSLALSLSLSCVTVPRCSSTSLLILGPRRKGDGPSSCHIISHVRIQDLTFGVLILQCD
jgi:hypothetical protein